MRYIVVILGKEGTLVTLPTPNRQNFHQTRPDV